jgi:hypothetical protein
LFPPLRDLRWEEISIVFISNDAIRITARDVSQVFTFAEAGFADKRKGDRPDERWVLLLGLARCHGEVTWASEGGPSRKTAGPKSISVLRGRLKALLGINTNPFQNYRKAKGYKARFKISDASHEQADGRHWNE